MKSFLDRTSRPKRAWYLTGEFLPIGLSGILAWYRADKLITSAGGIVSAWGDSSGTGDSHKNLTQSTTASRPTINLSDAAYNKKPTLSFARASTQYLLSGTWSSALAQPCTILLVGNDDGTALQQMFFDGIGASRLIVYQTGSGAYSSYAGADLLGGVASNTPKIFIAEFNSPSSNFFISARSGDSGDNGTSGLTGLTVGARVDFASALNGKIAELAIWNRTLTETEKNYLLNYAGMRYGITVT